MCIPSEELPDPISPVHESQQQIKLNFNISPEKYPAEKHTKHSDSISDETTAADKTQRPHFHDRAKGPQTRNGKQTRGKNRTCESSLRRRAVQTRSGQFVESICNYAAVSRIDSVILFICAIDRTRRCMG